jgi:flavin-dependent thymidylate synthase
MYSCLDRPGVCLNPTPGNNDLRIVANVRAIKEWSKFNNRFIDPKIPSDLGFCIQQLVKPLVPLALKDCNNTSQYFKGTLGQAHWPEERWYSFYISGVSRGLTHELVRHKYHTAISQRSTRYVDESESDWIWHPLIVKHIGLIDDMNAAGIRPTMHYAQDTYNDIVNILQDKLISEGIDKFQARKQSRGAARGILGNALSTELIWSASLDEIMRVIRQRASNGADAEIRLLANNLFELMKPEFDKLGIIYSTTPCSDGLGFEVTI